MLRNREWRPFASQWNSYRDTPLFEEEKILKNVWHKMKRQIMKKQLSKENLSHLLIAFQNIDEPARLSPKTTFEEFSVHFQRIDYNKFCYDDAELLYQTGQVCLAFSKPCEAFKYFKNAIEITILQNSQRVLKLDDSVKLMSKRRLNNECTFILTQLSLINPEYNHYRALAFIEAKNYGTAEKILSQCQRTTPINLLYVRLYFELKDWKKIRRPIHEIQEKELDETRQWKDKDLKAFLTVLYWIGKQAFEQKDYKEALNFFLQFTMLASTKESRIYELKELFLDLMPEVIEMVDQILEGGEEERSQYKLEKDLEETLFKLLYKLTQGGFDTLMEEKYLKAIMFETLSKLIGIRVFYNQSKVVLNILQYFTIFEAYAIMENRDLAMRELQEFVKNDGEHYKDDGFMETIYKEAHLYYANSFYYPEAIGNVQLSYFSIFTITKANSFPIECWEALVNTNEVKNDRSRYKWAMYSYTQGRILFEDQQHVKSIALFNQCAKVKYEPGEVYLWRPALSCIYLKNYEKALEFFKKFWNMRTSNLFNSTELTMTFLGQGYCATKLKRHNEAEKHFKQAEKFKTGEDIPSVPFYRMMAAYDRKNRKDTFKYLKLVMKSIKSVEKLVPFLQDKIVDEGRYLKDDWRNVLDVISDHSRALFPKSDVQQYKTYRNSSLIVLCLLNKKYD